MGALLDQTGTESFVAYRQRSDRLDGLCRALETRMHRSCAYDFVESVGECARAAEGGCYHPRDTRQRCWVRASIHVLIDASDQDRRLKF